MQILLDQALLVSIIAGFVVVIAVAIISPIRRKLVSWIRRLINRREDPIHGDWYIHFANNRKDKIHFRTDRLRLSVRVKTNTYRVSITPSEGAKRVIMGKGVIEKDFLVLNFHSNSTKITYHQRFRVSLENVSNPMLGFGVGQDFDGKASVNPCILAKVKLTPARFWELCDQEMSFSEGQYIQRIG